MFAGLGGMPVVAAPPTSMTMLLPPGPGSVPFQTVHQPRPLPSGDTSSSLNSIAKPASNLPREKTDMLAATGLSTSSPVAVSLTGHKTMTAYREALHICWTLS